MLAEGHCCIASPWMGMLSGPPIASSHSRREPGQPEQKALSKRQTATGDSTGEHGENSLPSGKEPQIGPGSQSTKPVPPRTSSLPSLSSPRLAQLGSSWLWPRHSEDKVTATWAVACSSAATQLRARSQQHGHTPGSWVTHRPAFPHPSSGRLKKPGGQGSSLYGSQGPEPQTAWEDVDFRGSRGALNSWQIPSKAWKQVQFIRREGMEGRAKEFFLSRCQPTARVDPLHGK